ncbi:hypothetical protein CKA32_002910 [Geitlerinema sp. FC II]|nr:hypothetical protein CKA32_002910 [Geitlerinema sp. FC II]
MSVQTPKSSSILALAGNSSVEINQKINCRLFSMLISLKVMSG